MNLDLKIRRDQIQRQLELAGVNIVSLGAGCIRLLGNHDSLVLTNDLLNLRVNELNRLCAVGAAV